jgi:CHAD domain-containing protein
MTMRAYAQQQTRTLLRRVAYQFNQTLRVGDADAVHDLRVSIRRFSQCLRVYAQFFPDGEARKIRQKLKTVMQAASAVRDYDITLELLQAAGIAKQSKAVAALDKRRKQVEKQLMDTIRGSSGLNFSRKWRARLEL